MTRRQSLIAQCLLYTLALLYSAWIFRQMPGQVPVHWGLSGKPDRWGSKWELAILLPVFALITLLPTWFLTKVMGEWGKDVSSRKSMYRILAVVAALFAVLHSVILGVSLRETQNAGQDVGRLMFAVLFGFFGILGNFMGTVRRNPYVGIRVPWTMKDDGVWEETHRRAAYFWFIGGIGGCLATLAGAPMPWIGAVMLAVVFWPLLDSYLIYRRRIG